MGAKRLNRVKIEWSANFAYAIGLITTDGNLSPDGRHIDLTSNDMDQLIVFKRCLGIENKIGYKTSGYVGTRTSRLQLGDVNFYNFLMAIGLKPNKSKTLSKLNIPDAFFLDFFRGCIDGDGSIDVHSHKESQHPQLKLRLCSASPPFLRWIKDKVDQLVGLEGGWIRWAGAVQILEYGKADSIKIIKSIYYSKFESALNRKYLIAKAFLN